MDSVTLEKKEVSPKLSRERDSPDASGVWHILHEHDRQLRLIEKDLDALKRPMGELSIQLAVLSKTVESISNRFDSRLSEQFLLHEKRESDMHQRVMVRGLLILLSCFGALVYYVLSKVTLAAVS